jgi:putative thiamine transport system substrate-binding protein
VAVTKPLWDFLDALHPMLWREGQVFPANSTEIRRLFADKETRIGFTFNPGDASAAIANNEFPPTVESYVLSAGTIGNVHFLAIPFNAANKAGAMVLANFLLSPEAQAKKLDPAVWGDQTVLDVGALGDKDRAVFDAVDLGPATLRPEALGTPLAEPDPSWVKALEAEWLKRYGAS